MIANIANHIPENKLKNVCSQHGLTYLGLFGSYARQDHKIDSDVDILIDYPAPKSFFELSGIKSDMENLFDRNVDLVLRRNVKPMLEPYIKRDLITIYEKN
ncbi:nucleotidyltransferase domain-containing protein [Patescibacteria group bacterium]|nr:nucleotidyltransferase domain-containing protein [Patescibacteria group bacterium]